MYLFHCDGVCVAYVRSFCFLILWSLWLVLQFVMHSRAYVCLFALGVVVCCLQCCVFVCFCLS